MVISALAVGVLIVGLALLLQSGHGRQRARAGSDGAAGAFDGGADGCESGSAGDAGCSDGGGGGGGD